MMRRLIAGLLLLTSFAFAREPILVSAKLNQGIWLVEGTVSGRKAIFMIDSGANRTILLPDPLLKQGEVDVKIQIGDFKTDSKAVVYPLHLLDWIDAEIAQKSTGLKPVVAVLGMDVLEKLAIGFDYDALKVAIWTGGKLDPKAGQDWAMVGAQKATPGKIDLVRRLDNRLALTYAIGGSKGWLMFDTGTSYTSILPAFAEDASTFSMFTGKVTLATSDQDEEMRAAREADFGGFKVPWVQYQKGLAGTDVPGKPDGLFAPSDLRSHRVLADFAGASVYFAQPDRTQMALDALRRWTRIHFAYEGGKLIFSPPVEGASDKVQALGGRPVVTIAGKSAKDVWDALMGTKPDAVAFMKDLYSAVQTNYVIQIESEGKIVNMQILP